MADKMTGQSVRLARDASDHDGFVRYSDYLREITKGMPRSRYSRVLGHLQKYTSNLGANGDNDTQSTVADCRLTRVGAGHCTVTCPNLATQYQILILRDGSWDSAYAVKARLPPRLVDIVGLRLDIPPAV